LAEVVGDDDEEELSGIGDVIGKRCLQLVMDRVSPHGVDERFGEPGVEDCSESDERKMTCVGIFDCSSGELSTSMHSYPSSPMYHPLFRAVCFFAAEHGSCGFARITRMPCFFSVASEISADAVRGFFGFGSLPGGASSPGGRSPGAPAPDAMEKFQEDYYEKDKVTFSNDNFFSDFD
jgi:hypothetical protein